MTATTIHPGTARRTLGMRHLAAALLAGAALGTTATFLAISPGATPAPAPAAVAPTLDGSSTTAGEQYLQWYTRDAGPSDGSTTAGEQYVDWYTRQTDAGGSTSATDQYRSWFLRDDDE